jgi:integrase
MSKWKPTKFPGVRYYDHPTRKHGVKFDQYFSIRYQRDGQRIEEGLGWSSENMTAEKAAKQLGDLKEAARLGKADATRLQEKREIEKQRREQEAKEKKQIEKEGITFSQFFTKTYFPISKTSKKRESWKKEEEHFRLYLEPVLGLKPLKDIKPLTVERVKKNILDAGRSPRFLQYVLATFRQVWNMARRDGLVSEESPSRAVKIQKIENKRVRFLSPEEAGDLLAYLKKGNQTIHDMAFLSLFSGMRFGEVKSLKWGAVDLDRGLITIFDAKGSKTRTAFMTPEVRDMLNGRNKVNPESLVFSTFDGREYTDTPTTFREAVDALGFNKGITDPRQKVVFHTLRHSYASWLAEAGTDIYTIGKLLGHSTVQMSARYAHLGAGAMQEAVKRLPTLTGDQAGKVVKLKKKS